MKRWLALICAAVLVMTGLTACTSAQGASVETIVVLPTELPEKRPHSDPYADKTLYQLSENLTEKQEDTDYGFIDEDVRYYSETAGDYKYCNVLLPPGYDETQKYPVLYMLHGWGSGYDVHLCEDSYLHILYGNMLREELTVPMIIVSVEMYTDKRSKRDDDNEKALLAAYNKVIKDIPRDLMPFIEKRYPVLTDRASTAIMGVSQGGTKALACGFDNLDLFGYIGSFAPDPGTIPTNFLVGTIWNDPLIDGFPEYSKKTAPFYVYLAVGADDPENVDVTKYYGQVLSGMGYKNTTDVVMGYEHDYIFWRVCFYNFLYRIFRG